MRGPAVALLLTASVALGPASPGGPLPDHPVPPPVRDAGEHRPPRCEERRLDNGLRLLVLPRRAVSSVHLVWSVRVGSAEDPTDLPGLAALLADAMAYEPPGTGKSLAETLRDRGVLLDVDVDRDSIRFSVQAPSGRLGWALRRLSRTMLRAPAGIDTARARALSALARLSEDPSGMLRGAAWRAIWGPEHSRGRPVRGTPASVRAIGLEDLRRHHRRWFRTDRMLVAVAGDVETVVLHRLLDGLAAPPPEASAPPARAAAPAAEPVPGRRILLVDRPGSRRSTIGLATRLERGTEPLDPAALVTSQLLGGPGYSRLLGSLRNQAGYAYDARSWIEFERGGGTFLAQATVDAENTAPALRRLLAVVESALVEPPPQELARARTSLRQRLLVDWFETNRSAARAWTGLNLLGLDGAALEQRLDGIAVVEAPDTAGFARRNLGPERLVVLVVGDAGTLRASLEALGFGSLEVWGADGRHAPADLPRDAGAER